VVFSVQFVLRLYTEEQLPLAVRQTDSWELQKQFGNPEEGERPPLEATTKECIEDHDCVIVICKV
jgi:hypothetical protein